MIYDLQIERKSLDWNISMGINTKEIYVSTHLYIYFHYNFIISITFMD